MERLRKQLAEVIIERHYLLHENRRIVSGPHTHPDVLERLQQAVWADTTPKRMTSVPVYDLAEVG